MGGKRLLLLTSKKTLFTCLIQVCSIDMVLGKGDANRVQLVAEALHMEQNADINLFYITEHHIVNTSEPRKGVSMEIKFKRKIMSEMMTTYLPSILLMIITFATTFFKPLLIEAALSVNLTTMLVMTTIFISKMEGLPPTSDIKMIDIWLILCQLVPFGQVLLLTAKEYLIDEEKEEKEVGTIVEDPLNVNEKENGVDEIEVDLNVVDEPKQKEAWVAMNKESEEADFRQKLLTIGKIFGNFKTGK